jgi:hypothetical protein
MGYALRILIVGDSIDRYYIDDWCRRRHQSLLTDQTIFSLTNISDRTLALREVLGEDRRRYRAWEIRICYAPTYNINVTYVFNKCGVGTSGPFHMPIMTMGGIEKSLMKSTSVEETFSVSLDKPMIAFQDTRISGGLPDVVIVHSMHWDLARLSREIAMSYEAKSSYNNDSWVQAWTNNATQLMTAVKKRIPYAQLYYWREATPFDIVKNANLHWNDQFAFDMWQRCVSSIRKQLPYNGFELLLFHTRKRLSKFSSIHLDNRDQLHPSERAGILFFDHTIKEIKKKKN